MCQTQFQAGGWKQFLVDATSWLGGNMTIKYINVSVIITGTETKIYPAPTRQALMSHCVLVLRRVLGGGRRYPHFADDGMEAQGGRVLSGCE